MKSGSDWFTYLNCNDKIIAQYFFGGSMNKFEKKFGKYAIKNLSLMLIMCYAVGYVLQLISPEFIYFLTLDPYKILHGQIWRVFTWIVVPPDSLDLFTIIMLYFYYSVGTSLERTWGEFRYNVYLLSGMLFTIVTSFIALGIAYLTFGEVMTVPGQAEQVSMMFSQFFSTYYINMSIFLAFAATFPNAQVLLMFIIPVRMKWMGIIYGAMLALQFIMGTGSGLADIFYRGALFASLLNFIIFWLTSRNHMHMTPKQVKRRHEFKQEVKMNTKVTKHKCAICGRSDEDDPTLEFRFCSKCEGNYEYCQYHLFTHQHVIK